MGCGCYWNRYSPSIKLHLSSLSKFFETLNDNRKLVLYEDIILDITRINEKLNSFRSIIGSELSPYLVPGFSIIDKKLYDEAVLILNQIEQYAIGRVPIPFFRTLYFAIDKNVGQFWKLQQRMYIAKEVSIVEFRKEGMRSALMQEGSFELSGKYFIVW